MKESNKSSIITGIVLLVIASFFSISLLLLPLDFGLAGPSHDNFFYKIGSVLFNVYGYSSIFIPLFLLGAGLTSFTSKWTARKTMRLITALVPFFTCVVTENLCRSLIKDGSKEFLGVKLAVIIITGVMLIVIEYLGAGIIADKISHKTRKSKVTDGYTKIDKFRVNGFEVSSSDSKDTSTVDETVASLKTSPLSTTTEEIDEVDEKNSTPTEEEEEKIDPKKLAIFDDVFKDENEKIPQGFADLGKKEDESFSPIPLSEDTTEDDISIIEDLEDIEEIEEVESELEDLDEDITSYAELEEVSKEEEAKSKELDKELQNLIEEQEEAITSSPLLEPVMVEEDTVEEEKTIVPEEVKQETKEVEDDYPINQTSVITQEEFAALTEPTPIAENKEPIDELEWPNLAPAPDHLPPEYDDDFDENDPDLEFPPKEEKVSFNDELLEDEEVNEENEESEDDSSNEEFDDFMELDFDKEASDIPFSVSSSTVTSGSIDNDLDMLDKEEEKEEFPFLLDEEDEEEDDQDPTLEYETTPIEDEEEEIEEPTIVSRKVEYDDSIHENPNFGYGIAIRDESDTDSKKDEEVQEVVEKPRYPRTISLQENVNVTETKDDEYEEDPTLPFPKFDIEEPAIVAKENENNTHATVTDVSIDDSFMDMEMEPLEEESEEIEEDDNDEVTSSMNDFADFLEKDNTPITPHQDKTIEIKSPRSSNSVFSDMEEDIRKSKGLEEDFEDEEIEEIDDDFEVEEDTVTDNIPIPLPVKNEEIKKNTNQIDKAFAPQFGDKELSANNLTADELSDFFDAQQEENTPKTNEIAANPKPIGNRAMKKGPYVIPSDLLTAYKDDQYWIIDEGTKKAAMNLKQTLSEFNIEASVTGIKKGPVVTMFEILPAPGVRLNKIVALADNIALSLAAQSVRIVAPIPGKQAVGIEVPNKNRSVVGFREIIEMDLPEWNKMKVPVILGKDILGKAQLIDLVKTPHMLIAGATGSGKSVCVNSLILSILYKRSYRDVKLILIDPKVVELKLYNDIPHLLTPVITEPRKALKALQYCLCEMERRYALLDSMGVRDISNYNQKIKEQNICTEKLPYIVVIIDEFADLMATSGKELENIVARLTAMSRAVGIHLVLATQRPSVNVITGLIKANIPTRIAFMVASRTDSNIIIDTVGAEKLLGKGDMLYASAVDPAPIRIQGTFVSDQEVENVVREVKEYGEPDYLDDSLFEDEEEDKATDLFGEPMSDDDPLYDQALEIVVQAGKASASFIQRRLKIGYNRAARLVEEMEERGIVGPANGSKPREIIHVP